MKNILAFIVILMAFVACKKDNNASNNDSSIVGKWKLNNVIYSFFLKGKEVNRDTLNNIPGIAYVEYKSDGKFLDTFIGAISKKEDTTSKGTYLLLNLNTKLRETVDTNYLNIPTTADQGGRKRGYYIIINPTDLQISTLNKSTLVLSRNVTLQNEAYNKTSPPLGAPVRPDTSIYRYGGGIDFINAKPQNGFPAIPSFRADSVIAYYIYARN